MKIGPAQAWINVNGKLCESPQWDADTQLLYWNDIDSGHLYRLDWANQTTQQPERIYEGPIVGGFTQQRDGSLLLFREADVAIFRPGDAEARSVIPFNHAGSKRFNDVIASPEGDVFAGTIGKTDTSGGLFRIGREGSVMQVADGTGCSNGLGFTLDLKHLFWTCSTRRRIYRFPYSPGGELGEPVIFHQGSEEQGYPDGLTLDSEGNVYSIRWTAQKYGLIVFNPDGVVIHQQTLPPRASSSLCFGGPTLTDLAITSAAEASDPDREADLYHIADMPIPGRLEFRSEVCS